MSIKTRLNTHFGTQILIKYYNRHGKIKDETSRNQECENNI